jgi:hypothetical protein
MTLLAQRHFILRHVIRLAPLIALVAAVDRAEAACDPVSPVSNVTVTCTGTTTNANGTNGYGTSSDTTGDTGNTYNIVSGASVSGTDNGLRFFTLGTVNARAARWARCSAPASTTTPPRRSRCSVRWKASRCPTRAASGPPEAVSAWRSEAVSPDCRSAARGEGSRVAVVRMVSVRAGHRRIIGWAVFPTSQQGRFNIN